MTINMGNSQCSVCKKVTKKCCDSCHKGYCTTCNSDCYHDRGVAQFGNNSLESFKKSTYQLSNDETKCFADQCDNIGIHKCESQLCCGFFCENHKTHSHFPCGYGGCPNQAITHMMEFYDIYGGNIYCKFHHDWAVEENNALYRATKTSNNYTSHGRCNDCKITLTYDRASIGYCAKCNGKWQALKRQCIPGPFG